MPTKSKVTHLKAVPQDELGNFKRDLTVSQDKPIAAEEAQQDAAETASVPEVQPALRKCPSHPNYFPDEDQMRPLTEFRRGKDGRIHPTYCVRCTYKKQAEYRKGKASTEGQDMPLLKTFISELQQRVIDLAAQIDTGDQAQLDELAAAFGMAATDAVRPLLLWYVEQRNSLPSVVHDQRHVVTD